MFGIHFRKDDLAFVDPDQFATPAVKSWKGAFDSRAELAAAASGLILGGAPLASWLLARLAGLSESSYFPKEFVRKDGELGGYRIALLAVRGSEPLTLLRLTADSEIAELWAASVDTETARSAAESFIAALMAKPAELAMCSVEVRARELGGHRNEYGYDGTAFLGQHNARA